MVLAAAVAAAVAVAEEGVAEISQQKYSSAY
jgi:hypothetical protein